MRNRNRLKTNKNLKKELKMRHKNKKSRKAKVKSYGAATLFTFVFSFSIVMAQESVNTTSGDASGSKGSVSYSVGQIAYQTHTDTSISVAEGVQQAYIISVFTGLEETPRLELSVIAYPNPSTNNLILEVKELEFSTLSFQLFDMQGRLLQSKNITCNQTNIVMSRLTPATYFIKIIKEGRDVKTFKIIKN